MRASVLFRCRHHKFSALANRLGPALHDAFLFGVEAHAFFSVGMHVAEQALLPATKAMPCHGHRDRYVDAAHADFDAARKLASGVAEFVGVHERDSGCAARDATQVEHVCCPNSGF